jgi:hypothetical protein
MVFEDDTVYEVLTKLRSIVNNHEVYIMSAIDGKGCHIGKITGVSLDANDDIVIEADIDSVSATE